jgi:hypothetical protein
MTPAWMVAAMEKEATARYAAEDAARPRAYAYAPTCPGRPGEPVTDGPADDKYDAPSAKRGVEMMVL